MEEYELLNNRPIDGGRSLVSFDSDVTNRVGMLIDAIGGPGECD
jgi:hypothetical protein